MPTNNNNPDLIANQQNEANEWWKNRKFQLLAAGAVSLGLNYVLALPGLAKPATQVLPENFITEPNSPQVSIDNSTSGYGAVTLDNFTLIIKQMCEIPSGVDCEKLNRSINTLELNKVRVSNDLNDSSLSEYAKSYLEVLKLNFDFNISFTQKMQEVLTVQGFAFKIDEGFINEAKKQNNQKLGKLNEAISLEIQKTRSKQQTYQQAKSTIDDLILQYITQSQSVTTPSNAR